MAPSKTEQQRRARLADVRVPRYSPVVLIIGILLSGWQRRRDLRAVADAGKEIGELTARRWQETDHRADRLIALTKALAYLTAVLLLVTAGTLVVILSKG